VTIAFITGATDGLGRSLAEALAAEGVSLLLHGRSAERLATVEAELGAKHPGSVIGTVRADLAELAQVHRLADDVLAMTDRLDVFVSNAGIGSGQPEGPSRSVSADGYELRFAVNYLAGFALTQQLLPLLRASAPARIVYVASLGQSPVDWDDVMIERGYNGTRAYGQSKLAQITSGFTLAAQLPADEVTVNSLHPSTYMPTKMVMLNGVDSIDTLQAGTEATRRLAADPAVAGVTGKFYDRLREARAEASAYDPEVQQKLWELSVSLTAR
jgi:NAD(P)-dependent dehydrogenase (short-subunit alcohol dehydrogenase family)